MGISGLVVEYIVAIDVTRVRFPADAICHLSSGGIECYHHWNPGLIPYVLPHAVLPTWVMRDHCS